MIIKLLKMRPLSLSNLNQQLLPTQTKEKKKQKKTKKLKY